MDIYEFEDGVSKKASIDIDEMVKILKSDEIDQKLEDAGFEENICFGNIDIGPCMRVFTNTRQRYGRKYLIEVFITEDIYSYWFCSDFKNLFEFLSRYGVMFQVMELREIIDTLCDSLDNK